MNIKSRKIILSNGAEIETPLLIPSFSSKGYRFRKTKSGKVVSECKSIIKTNATYLTSTILVSAYDIYYKHIPVPFSKIKLFPEFTIIDSGGYETNEGYGFSEVFKFPITAKDWSTSKYKEVLNEWSARYPAAIVCYDHGEDRRTKIENQIKRANKLFQKYTRFAKILLLKSIKKNEYIPENDIIENIPNFKDFDILGFTEKELGDSMLNRLKFIIHLRKKMNESDISIPIHIFGSLDPITSVLYFLAGAEIFDGLTWSRYGYKDGNAVYTQNYGFVEFGNEEKDYIVRDLTYAKNINYLKRLTQQMKSFAATGGNDFNIFESNSKLFKKVNKLIH